MSNTIRLQRIRKRLTDELSKVASANGLNEDPNQTQSILREAVLIRDDHYCGRTFYLDSFRAVWFFEADEVKIFDQNGIFLERIQNASELVGSSMGDGPMLSTVQTAEDREEIVDSEESSRIDVLSLPERSQSGGLMGTGSSKNAEKDDSNRDDEDRESVVRRAA